MERKNNSSNQNESETSMSSLFQTLKANSEIVKGAVALLFGSYLISIKYYVVMDFLLLIAGFGLVLYGLATLKFTKVQEYLTGLMSKMNQSGEK